MTETLQQNVDPSEISKFERLASRWWDQSGEFKPLHDINPLRTNYIDMSSPVAEKNIIDVGCGGGILCEALTQRGANVTGIDMGKAPLDVAKLHALESGLSINYQQNTAENMAASSPASYDIVTCLEMLEHVPDPSSVIRACAAMVKNDGYVYFSTLNRNPKSYAFAILGAEYVLKMLPKGTHEYKKFIKPAELASWVRAAGLVVEDVCGMTYNPLTKKYRLDDNDVDVNYLMRAKKPSN